MIDLFKVLPPLLQNDNFSQSIAKVLNKYLNEINEVYDSLFIMKNLHKFKDEVLDEIAKDKSILWYDSMLPIERKIDIIKNHRLVYRILGSEKAVLQLIKDYFRTSGGVENWYEYGSTHHRFRIILNDLSFTSSFLDFFYRFLDSLKWVKSADTWLDEIILNRNIYKSSYTGCVIGNTKYTNIIVTPNLNKAITNLYDGMVLNKVTKLDAYIKAFIPPVRNHLFKGLLISKVTKLGTCVKAFIPPIKNDLFKGIIINKITKSNIHIKVIIPPIRGCWCNGIVVNKVKRINQYVKGVLNRVKTSFLSGIVLNNLKIRRCYIGK